MNLISGVKLIKEEKMYYLLANNSCDQTSFVLEKEAVINQSYLNKHNFDQVSKSQFSLLNFEDSKKSLSFEPYEIKLIQVSL